MSVIDIYNSDVTCPDHITFLPFVRLIRQFRDNKIWERGWRNGPYALTACYMEVLLTSKFGNMLKIASSLDWILLDGVASNLMSQVLSYNLLR